MNTEDFLDILEQRELVPTRVVESMREKVQKGEHRITAKSILKFLVKKELVTQRQAKQLLETTLTVTSNAESSILGFVPSSPKPPASIESVGEPIPEEDIPTLAPVDSDGIVGSSQQPEPPTLEQEAAQEDLGSFVAESLPADTAPSQSGAFVAAAAAAAGDELKKKGSKKGKDKKKRGGKKNEWDSPLLLLGGGGLIVLILTGVIVATLLNRENADTVLAEASEFFEGGSYTQAINQYERFVENFPGHPQYSTAKVRLGMARLWKAASGTTRFVAAKETAQQVLDEIEDEPDFAAAQRDLASLLPDIAAGLARQAEEAVEPELVNERLKQTETVLSLCNNTKYIPTTFRDEVVLNSINETLDLVRRGREQKAQLQQALIEMQKAIEAHSIAEAYQIHRTLLEEVPGLLNNEELAEKVREVSAAEQQVVNYIAEPKEAETLPRPSKVVAELALADRRGNSAPGVEGVVTIRVDGAVYGLNASNGALLWRKFVGFDHEATPLALPEGDFLIVDAAHDELVRLQESSGELVWRLAFDGPILRPVVIGSRVLIAEQAGKLHVVEIENGTRSGYVEFGQSLSVPPTVGNDNQRIYLLGDHSSLFTLSAEDYSCLGVFYLGHAPGSVSVPLAISLNKVFAAVNTGIETCQLHMLSTDDNGVVAANEARRRQNGLINTRLLVEGRRLVAVTNLGETSVYDVGAGSGEEALTTLASREAESVSPIARFGLLHEGHVWTADNQLSKLEILPTGNRLPVRNLDRDYLNDLFDYPLQAIDDVLIHVRRPLDGAGALVASMNMLNGQALWEIELAAPPAGPPAVDQEDVRLAAATSTGTVYELDRNALSRRVLDQGKRVANDSSVNSPYVGTADLGQGRLAVTSANSDSLLHFRPDTPQGSLTSIQLPGPASDPPAVWGDGFVVATQVGQVFLFACDDGRQLGTPFQPPLEPGAEYDWLPPASYGSENESRLVLSDGANKIYLLKLVQQSQPHLAAEVESEIGDSPLNTRLAVLGDKVVAGTEGGQLARFQLPSLQTEPSVALDTQITWGPFSVADRVILATAKDELVGLDPEGEISWRQPLTNGPPVGMPIGIGSELFVLWQQGGLSRVNWEDGTELAHLELDRQVVAGPVAFGKRFVLSSSDGTLLVVDRP